MPDVNNVQKFVTPAQFASYVKPLRNAALASVSGAAFREETDTTIMLLKALSAEEMGSDVLLLADSWKKVQQIVRLGLAKTVFSIGDKLYCNRAGVELEWDVIGIDHDTPSDPRFTHSLTLQLHDCFPTLIQFDAPEAFYYCGSALEAKTYYFTVNGTNYQFTLESDIDAGSQLILNFTGDTPTSIFVSDAVGGDFVKDTNGTDDLTIAVTAGSGGKELNGDYINDINRVRYGNNQYKESAIRQWLGSSAAAGSFVWTPQNNFDRPPAWKDTAAGFLNGMDADFLAVLGNVTKVTAKSGGGSDTTNDTFFLLSKSEVYGGVEVSGVNEGAAYPYYSDYSSLSAAGMGSDRNRIKYLKGTEPPATQYWWNRTPHSGGGYNVRSVDTAGTVKYGGAIGNGGVAPACNVI